jgi:hypothetical protein
MDKLIPDEKLVARFCEDCAMSKAKKLPHKSKSKLEVANQKALKKE